MSSRTIASLAEQHRAKLFLQTLGATGFSNQMILAVIAFLRVTDRNTDKLVVAAARLLLARTVYHPYPAAPYPGIELLNAKNKQIAADYKLTLTALRHNHAEDFLVGIAMSEWDPTHFGGWSPAGIDSAKNRLFQTYGSFTGLAVPTPPPPKPQKPHEFPKLPRDLQYTKSTRQYLDPWAAGSLYEGRHRAVDAKPRRR